MKSFYLLINKIFETNVIHNSHRIAESFKLFTKRSPQNNFISFLIVQVWTSNLSQRYISLN